MTTAGGQRADRLANRLAETGRRFYARGWVLGTSGNFSAVLAADPIELLITASGVHKGRLTTHHFLRIDAAGQVRGAGDGHRPSRRFTSRSFA